MTIQTKELTLVDGDDWMALYVNGQEFSQNHSISDVEWLEAAVGCTRSRRYPLTEAGLEGLYQAGRFPTRLDEIPNDWLDEPEIFPSPVTTPGETL